jgi:hypothetical protein
MAGNGYPKRPSRPRTSLAAIRRIAERIYIELEHYLYKSTVKDRDAFVATNGEQLQYLAPLLDVLSLVPDEREQQILIKRAWLIERREPDTDSSSVGWYAIQLARSLNPYVTGTERDRNRLLRKVGYQLAVIYIWVSILTEDRAKREELVMEHTQYVPVLSLAISPDDQHRSR